MFYDLSLQWSRDEDAQSMPERVAMAIRLGYDCVAHAATASGRLTDADCCRIVAVTAAAALVALPGVSEAARAHQSLLWSPAADTIRQLTRLTVRVDEAAQAAALGSAGAITSTYDLLAVQPVSERALGLACSSLDVDLISLDLGARKLPFRLRPATLAAALARGLTFEVTYAGVFDDPAARRAFFANAASLVRATAGRGIVLSSGARRAFDLRGPYDVMNLATVFGLEAGAAKDALSITPTALLRRATARRSARGGLLTAQPADAATQRAWAAENEAAARAAAESAAARATAVTGASADPGAAVGKQPGAAVAAVGKQHAPRGAAVLGGDGEDEDMLLL